MTRLHWTMHVIGALVGVAIATNWLLAVTDWSTRADLTLVGAMLEATGLTLLALDIFGSQIGRGWEWLTRWGIRTRLSELYWNVVGRFTGTRARVDVSVRAVPGGATASGIPPAEVYGERGSFGDIYRHLRDIRARISSIETQNKTEHEQLRKEITERDRRVRRDVEEWIAQGRDRFLPWRLLGFALALAGTIVLALANLAG